jgi:hypothetical protein
MPLLGLGSRPRRRFSSPERVPASRNALTASGARVKRGDADALRRLAQPWQTRSFAYYDLLGEIKYAAQFYARMLEPLELFAAEIDVNHDVVPTENPEAVAALARIQDPGGGRTGLLGSYGRLMFLCGEANLFVTTDPETGLEQWEMLSADEIRYQGGVYQRISAPSLQAQQYREEPNEEQWTTAGDGAISYRLWQRHPRYSALADSTMMGVLDICEEIVLLTQAVRARARSRLAGPGILFIDDKISPPPLEPAPDEDVAEDPLLADLVEAMTTPITDEGSASAVVPLLVRVPVPEGFSLSDMVKHLQIIDPTQLDPETGLRYELIKRLAIGLDMPPEILLGMATANHWTGWMIDEQTWKGHGQPKAQQLTDDLTAAYFRPMLREAGVTDWARYLISYDASKIINHPDRTKDAKELYDRAVIGKAALRREAAFDEADAMTEAERAERIGVLVRDPSLAWYGIPSPRGGAIEPEAGVIESAQYPVAGGAPSTGSEVQPGPPEGDGSAAPQPVSQVGSANDRLLAAARIAGAADLAVARAREAAGNRLRSLAKRDKDAAKLLEGVPVPLTAHVLGPECVRGFGCSEAELVAVAGDLIRDALRIMGVEDPALAALVAENVEKHAARTLYEKSPPPLPEAFTNYAVGLASGAVRT